MHGSPSNEGPSTVESGPSSQPQYSSHNYPPPNSPAQVIQPNVPAYGPALPTSQYQYPPPPPAPFAAHAYPPPSSFPFSEPGPGFASAPRQRTSIACRYCRKRKIRCSGFVSGPGGKCQNCARMNQECIFAPVSTSSSTAFVPENIPTIPEAIPPKERTYGSFSRRFSQAQHQNNDISTSEYRAYPNPYQDYHYYSQQFTFPPPAPPADQQGGYGDDRHTSFRRRQDDSDSAKAYIARGKFFGADIAMPIDSEPTIDGFGVSAPWESRSASRPGKPVQTPQGGELQPQLPIPSLSVLQSFEPRFPASSLAIRQDNDQKDTKVVESSVDDVEVKLRKPPQVSKESMELPDPSRLRIRSLTPSSSPTVSSDIEVESISADSEGQFDRKSRGYCVFSQVFSRLAILCQNEVMTRGESSSSNSKGKQVAKGVSASSSGARDTASFRGGQKNPRQGDDDGDESRDRQNEPPKKKGKTSQPHCDERSQFLACPYWKADSKKYWDCFLKKNDTIAHLKQHLTRRHTPKYYCQICYQTFREFDLFDSHALDRSCTRGPSAKLEGISQQQKNQLSLKSKGSVEQQWYTVWSILFPGLEPPATIYIYSTQSEDFCRIQEFAQREGVTIMLDELESNGLIVRPDASNQLLRSTVQRAMVSIFTSYSNRGEASCSEAEEPIFSQAAEPDHGVSLQQESNTEGQMGHGNNPTSCTDVHQMTEDGRDSSMVGTLDRPSRSTCSQLPVTTSWLPRGVVLDDAEDGLWGTTFLDGTEFRESSPGGILPLNLESSDMLDLDALLRDVISTEA
ncbi:uncharacterized protein FTJAE_8436 [Fusarium tjaetaba]|uniref:Zn(2)-C6 fungal-type domain-containing protein n=1 Tax=Fusarium tjaetaba TaxID=1567544 RepID=A0A8H5VNF8_9HYPO|nr:uncharacterized protein FTJAE_8436 [Fusarium tjaetaba]KAF5629791.1 hypothetical protein FTJAE_8436 [Fusarium tjaetaba]